MGLDPLAYDRHPLDDAMFPEGDIMPANCPICGTETIAHQSASDLTTVACGRCGTFRITGSARAMTDAMNDRQRVLLSGLVRDHLLAGKIVEIGSDQIRASKDWILPVLIERAHRMLRWAVLMLDHKPSDSDLFLPTQPTFLGATYSRDATQATQVAKVLAEFGYANPPATPRSNDMGLARFTTSNWQLTAKGRLFAETLEREQAQSTTGFVAMWFDPSMVPVWADGLQPGVANAGFDPVRIDTVEHINKIDDEIMLQIRASRFVVADFTGHRGGVYFEAGYALGLGLPVIWTCRRDDMAKLHFDIRQYNCIDWQDPEDLRHRLTNRIVATAGRGPRVTGTNATA